MIKQILASKVHNSRYLNKYITFINNCQLQNKGYNGYTEKHHICPRAMFPEFDSFIEFTWNCAKLTPRQHFIAHLLLYKTYPNERSQAQTMYFMTKLHGTKITSKLYSKLKLEAIEASKGKVAVRDSVGNTFQVDNTDDRFLSGELVSTTKGRAAVKDSNGNTFQVDKNDYRILSGELTHITKGRVSEKRTLTTEQIIEIKKTIKDPTTVITNEYIAIAVKPSQKYLIGKIPFEELRYNNGMKLSYKSLIAKYYSNKFGINGTVVTKIIEGKSYRDITV